MGSEYISDMFYIYIISLIFNHSSLPYITDTNELILTYTIEQKYKNG